MLALLVLVANLFFTKVSLGLANNSEYVYSTVDPLQEIEVLREIDPYTSNINENVDSLESQLALNQNDGYLSKDLGGNSLNTEIANKDFEYAIQNGDTLTTIAQKFDLHVQSIVDKNNIDVAKMENLKPGQKIIIPGEDTSSSTTWLADLNTAKEKARQLALKQEQDKQKKLAQSKLLASANRSTVVRDRSGYDGSFSGNFIVPISSMGISRGVSSYHAGIDYRASIGTSVRAAADGKVIAITGGWGGGFGNSILVDHGNGTTTRYAHLSDVRVGIGDYVNQGEQIAFSGNTGNSTGPHLHFETRVNGRAINPF